MASLADYEAAYALAAEVLRETLTDVKKPLREALQRIQGLAAKGEGSVSRREIREALGVPGLDRAALAAELVDLEYLAAGGRRKGGQGKATRYRLADREPHPDALLGPLSPAELGGRARGNGKPATSPKPAKRPWRV